LPVGGGCRVLGPSTSRFRFSGVDDEAVAAAMLRRNKSSRALPRPGGVSLRHHRRARGGCAPAVELMYRRSSPSARRPVREVSSIGFWFVGTEAAWGLAVVWRKELQIQSSCGGSGRRQWICLQDLRSSGRVPGRCFLSVCFILLFGASVYCGSFKASRRWGSSCPAVGGVWPPAMDGGDGLWWIRLALGQGTWL